MFIELRKLLNIKGEEKSDYCKVTKLQIKYSTFEGWKQIISLNQQTEAEAELICIASLQKYATVKKVIS